MPLSRRDFLRFLALAPFAPAVWRAAQQPTAVPPTQATGPTAATPNILLFVMDAFSASHTSLHGYQRETTPNLARFAEKAMVYHNHYAGGNFTSAGTASLLTGTYPWTNRAFNIRSTVVPPFTEQNIFTTVGPTYHRLAYTHNFLAQLLLNQFAGDIELLLPMERLFLTDEILSDILFNQDINTAMLSEDMILPRDERLPSSLFLSLADEVRRGLRAEQIKTLYGAQFPAGFPSLTEGNHPFRLEDTIDWLIGQVQQMPRPFFAYCHCLPPHEPYRPRAEFTQLFPDGWVPPTKPQHHFSQQWPQPQLNQYRLEYDRYMAYADAEFGRLYDNLTQMGLLENTYIIVTSDHGQLFERGIHGHITHTLYEPVVHVPLLIHKPGQQTRQDVTNRPTSATDILPTLRYITNQPAVDWTEGQILPQFDETAPHKRSKRVFSFEGKANRRDQPLMAGTAMLLNGAYKFIHTFGYKDFQGNVPFFTGVNELYNLEEDPEELNNLFQTETTVASDMYNQIRGKLIDVDKPYL